MKKFVRVLKFESILLIQFHLVHKEDEQTPFEDYFIGGYYFRKKEINYLFSAFVVQLYLNYSLTYLCITGATKLGSWGNVDCSNCSLCSFPMFS